MAERRPAAGAGRGRAPADAAGGKPALRLSLQFADAGDRALITRPKVLRWVRAALERPAELTVRIVGDAEGRRLNREFRAKDAPTNVLTFAYAGEAADDPVVVADLVLCAPVLRREAGELGIPLEAHYAHLLVHGTLHAQGRDHEAEDEAVRMEAEETRALTGLGFADPYARHASPAPGPPLNPSAGGPGSASSRSTS